MSAKPDHNEKQRAMNGIPLVPLAVDLVLQYTTMGGDLADCESESSERNRDEHSARLEKTPAGVFRGLRSTRNYTL